MVDDGQPIADEDFKTWRPSSTSSIENAGDCSLGLVPAGRGRAAQATNDNFNPQHDASLDMLEGSLVDSQAGRL